MDVSYWVYVMDMEEKMHVAHVTPNKEEADKWMDYHEVGVAIYYNTEVWVDGKRCYEYDQSRVLNDYSEGERVDGKMYHVFFLATRGDKAQEIHVYSSTSQTNADKLMGAFRMEDDKHCGTSYLHTVVEDGKNVLYSYNKNGIVDKEEVAKSYNLTEYMLKLEEMEDIARRVAKKMATGLDWK